jgi:aspartokinase/homoserine dehydrogenase 1
MIGVPGTAHRLFGALRDAGISVILISQGSSEHSICFAIPAAQAEAGRGGGARAFDAELRDGQIQHVDVAWDLSHSGRRGRRHGRRARRRRQGVQLAGRCGDQCARHRAGRLGAQHLPGGRRQGRREGAARGACEPSICRPIHLSIGLIGPGTVGRVLLAQIATQVERLRALNLDLRVRGIAGSKRMLLEPRSHRSRHWAELPRGEGRAARSREVRGALPGRLHPAYGADRLHRKRRRGVATTATGWRAASTW